jgi:hypothetical protein
MMMMPSDAVTTDKPASSETTAEPPPVKAEPPFNVDVLNTCTARFSRKAWNQFLAIREDLQALQTRRFRVALNARTETGLQEVMAALQGLEATALKQSGVLQLECVATLAQVQGVARHPQTHWIDLIPAEQLANR